MAAIAFTYDLTTATGQARMYAGDTDPAGLNRTGGDRTRTDEEIAFLLAQNGSDARLAAAALLENKAAEYAAVASYVKQGSLAQDFRLRSQEMREAADRLREVARNRAGIAFTPASAPAPFTLGEGGTMDGW